MSYPVLPIGATCAVYIRKQYPGLLKDIVRDCTDIINAIRCFGTLVSEYELAEDGFKKFDAHGGDTACHVRASMLLEIYQHYRQQAKVSGKGFLEDVEVNAILAQLHTVRRNAQDICAKLTKEKRQPQEFGLEAKRDNMIHVVEVLGWQIDPEVASPTSSSPGSSDISTSPTSSDSSAPSTAASASSPVSMAYSSFIPSSISSLAALSTTEWDVGDPKLCILFLAASSILSDYKEFARMGSRITVRFLPDQAMEYGNRLIAPYWDRTNSNYADFRINRVKDRHCHLQKWMSRISCSWIHSWAKRLSLSPPAQRMLIEATRQSPRDVSVVAAFPAFLVCRRAWTLQGWPLLLINRNFCSQGYHISAYIALPMVSPPKQQGKGQEPSLFEESMWPLQPVSLEDLTTNPNYKGRPYITIFGNSMDSSHLDYLSTAYREDGHHKYLPHHENSSCPEHQQHTQKFIATDHDELSKSLLADHCQYPFPTPPRQRELDGKMDAVWCEVEAQRVCYAAKVNELGGGPENINVFCWEHVFAETPERVALEVQRKVLAGDLNLFF